LGVRINNSCHNMGFGLLEGEIGKNANYSMDRLFAVYVWLLGISPFLRDLRAASCLARLAMSSLSQR
jgi:hypothetical protein